MSDETPTAQPAPAVDPAVAAAIAQAVVAALRPAPVAAPGSPVDAAVQDATTAPSAYKPGSLAIYEHDHFGKKKYQVMLVIGVYDVWDETAGALQERLRMLPLGNADAYSDLPSDQVTAADAFDWEATA